MQGLIDQLPADERMTKAQDYLDAVFQKHGITEAQFDSSLVYYNRYPSDLYKIYANLQEQLAATHEELQVMNGNNDMMAVFAEGGDTINLWSSSPLIVLRNKNLLNRESFNIYSDGNFHRHDKFIMTFSPRFIRESNDAFDIRLYVGLTVVYTNGKHTGTTRMVMASGTNQLTITAVADEDIQQVQGFFYYEGKTGIRNLCMVDDIQLVCMHEKPVEQTDNTVQQADSLTAESDSTETDSMPRPLPVEYRKTPEEIRLLNKSKIDNINIQEAPSVRHPNSIGPKRRKNSKANKKTL